jgi:integrase
VLHPVSLRARGPFSLSLSCIEFCTELPEHSAASFPIFYFLFIPFVPPFRSRDQLTFWGKTLERKDFETGLLFRNRRCRPIKRSHVVKFGLKPILQKLRINMERVGLHAFRHGLGAALCEREANPATVQKILRHSDIRTTLKYYVHSDLDSRRQALDQL